MAGTTDLVSMLPEGHTIGSIRSKRASIYVFTGGNEDAALLTVNGFSLLLDGGDQQQIPYWNLIRNYDKVSAVLATRMSPQSLTGISTIFARKLQQECYPYIGTFIGNLPPRNVLSSENDVTHMIKMIYDGLQAAGIKANEAFTSSKIEPITLYEVIGEGALRMIVLNPERGSKELSALWSAIKSGENVEKHAAACSLAAIFVWHPADASKPTIRILYPGACPLEKLYTALEKLKSEEYLRYLDYTSANREKYIMSSHASSRPPVHHMPLSGPAHKPLAQAKPLARTAVATATSNGTATARGTKRPTKSMGSTVGSRPATGSSRTTTTTTTTAGTTKTATTTKATTEATAKKATKQPPVGAVAPRRPSAGTGKKNTTSPTKPTAPSNGSMKSPDSDSKPAPIRKPMPTGTAKPKDEPNKAKPTATTPPESTAPLAPAVSMQPNTTETVPTPEPQLQPQHEPDAQADAEALPKTQEDEHKFDDNVDMTAQLPEEPEAKLEHARDAQADSEVQPKTQEDEHKLEDNLDVTPQLPEEPEAKLEHAHDAHADAEAQPKLQQDEHELDDNVDAMAQLPEEPEAKFEHARDAQADEKSQSKIGEDVLDGTLDAKDQLAEEPEAKLEHVLPDAQPVDHDMQPSLPVHESDMPLKQDEADARYNYESEPQTKPEHDEMLETAMPEFGKPIEHPEPILPEADSEMHDEPAAFGEETEKRSPSPLPEEPPQLEKPSTPASSPVEPQPELPESPEHEPQLPDSKGLLGGIEEPMKEYHSEHDSATDVTQSSLDSTQHSTLPLDETDLLNMSAPAQRSDSLHIPTVPEQHANAPDGDEPDVPLLDSTPVMPVPPVHLPQPELDACLKPDVLPGQGLLSEPAAETEHPNASEQHHSPIEDLLGGKSCPFTAGLACAIVDDATSESAFRKLSSPPAVDLTKNAAGLTKPTELDTTGAKIPNGSAVMHSPMKLSQRSAPGSSLGDSLTSPLSPDSANTQSDTALDDVIENLAGESEREDNVRDFSPDSEDEEYLQQQQRQQEQQYHHEQQYHQEQQYQQEQRLLHSKQNGQTEQHLAAQHAQEDADAEEFYMPPITGGPTHRMRASVGGPATQRPSMGGSANKPKLSQPLYFDVVFVPHRGAHPALVDEAAAKTFATSVRSKRYVISGKDAIKPYILDGFVAAKTAWNKPEAEVDIVPTHESDDIRAYNQLKSGEMQEAGINLRCSVERCTLRLSSADSDDFCAAFKFEM